MELINSKTYQNLARAYAGECQARTRYEFIEFGARKQGFTALADIIAKVIFNEFNHARMFYTFLQQASPKCPIENIEVCAGYPFKEKWDLVDNLKFAAEDESIEMTKIYPEFAKIATQEGFADIAMLFNNTAKVESCHNMLFTQLHKQMKDGTMYKKPQAVKWKCGDCGHEQTLKEAWQKCPLCDAAQGAVMIKIEDEA